MNITVAKVKRILIRDYGWENFTIDSQRWFIEQIIRDTIKVVNNELKIQKGVSIKK
jgi:hypothetical protein